MIPHQIQEAQRLLRECEEKLKGLSNITIIAPTPKTYP